MSMEKRKSENKKSDNKKAEVKSIKLDQIKSLSSIDIDLKNLQKLADKFDKKVYLLTCHYQINF